MRNSGAAKIAQAVAIVVRQLAHHALPRADGTLECPHQGCHLNRVCALPNGRAVLAQHGQHPSHVELHVARRADLIDQEAQKLGDERRWKRRCHHVDVVCTNAEELGRTVALFNFVTRTDATQSKSPSKTTSWEAHRLSDNVWLAQAQRTHERQASVRRDRCRPIGPLRSAMGVGKH